MIQQINLYKDSLKQQQSKPALNSYIYGFAAILFLLLAYSIFTLKSLSHTKNEIQIIKQQITAAEAELIHIKNKYPRPQINTLLTQEISHAEIMLGSLSQVVHLLNDKDADTTQGFSRYFSALATQSIPEVWLTNININSQDHTLSLQGSTYQAEKIAHFLQKLPNEAVFQGRSFAQLIMTQAEKNEDQLNFVINSTIPSSE